MIHRKSKPEIDPDEPASKLAFPKSKYVPRANNATPDSALAFRKELPDRDRSYLDFVRGQSCAAWGEDAPNCNGVTEAAHLEVPHKGQKASDYVSIPLCTAHHRLQHQMGVARFQITIGVNLWEVAARSLVAWIRVTKRQP